MIIHSKELVSFKFIHAHKHRNLSLQFNFESQLVRQFDSTSCTFYYHSIYNTATTSIDLPLTKGDTLARTSFIKWETCVFISLPAHTSTRGHTNILPLTKIYILPVIVWHKFDVLKSLLTNASFVFQHVFPGQLKHFCRGLLIVPSIVALTEDSE